MGQGTLLYRYGKTAKGSGSRCIMRGVSSWLFKKPAPPIQHISYLASYQLIKAYEHQSQIGWDQFLKGRLSTEWSTLALIRFEYSTLIQNAKKLGCKPKYRTPESWVKGLRTLNWEFVNLLWEQWISSLQVDNIQTANETNDTQNNHYFLLQKAYHKLKHHHLTNNQDQTWLLKSQNK